MRKLFAGVMILGLVNASTLLAVDFHVTTAQELQNALTTASVNGAGDTIYLAAGYYIGNFNFNSAEDARLTVQAELGVANTDATLDGAGVGRALAITCSGNAPITITGLTFNRNCGSVDNAALRIATGTGDGADVLVEDCRLIGANSAAGIGLEVTGARDATVRSCSAIRDATSNGDGISITDAVRDVLLDRNVFDGASKSSGGRGVYVSGASMTTLTGNTFSGNKVNGSGGGAYINGAATLTGNTFSYNYSDGGGGGGGARISGTATLTGNTFSYNFSDDGGGGGVYVSGTATLTGNTFSGNSCAHYNDGGGARISGTATLTENTFSGNSSSGDGGGACFFSTATLIGNTFSGNFTGTYGDGGGAWFYRHATLTNNMFSGNISSRSGGGICFDASTQTLTLEGNTFMANSSTGTGDYSGGGVYILGNEVNLYNNIIAENQLGGTGKGGGVRVNAKTQLDMINNTITDNTAAGSGGGVAFQVDGVTEILNVYNNVIWGNTAGGDGVDVHLAGTGSRKEFKYNDAHDMYGVWDIAENNIDLAPLFYDPVNGNYHQRFGSPTIDAGDNSAPEIPATDIDGETRAQDVAVDIGADEFNNTDLHPADLNDNGIIEESEYNAYAAAWKNDQSWSRTPNPVPADYVTRAGYLLKNGGGYYNNGGVKPVCWKPNL